MKMKSALLLLSGILLFKGATFAQGSNGGGDNRNNYQISIGRVNEQIVVDGDLLESTWRSASAATDFWMSFPVDDERANPEIQTEVRMAYDDNFIYLGVTCHGDDSYVIQTLKRDKDFWSGDAFAVVFDPVGERTNGFVFGVNPAGVQLEMLNSGQSQRRSTDTRRPPQGINIAWDNKWFSEVKNYPDKWTIEIAIPFKTLRYDEEKGNWGINFTRSDKKSNSFHSWAPVPIQFMTIDLGYTGSLAWDTPPIKQKGNVSVIPYALGATSKNFEENTDPESNFRAGFDAKAAVTSSLNLDLTVLPDFSQVDVDEQVTNLTRFNIRLPEKRLFFLENSDIFEDFGIPPMKPFFSRRLGLDEDGNAIPILYGMRLSGNVNKNLRMGLMNLQTKETAEFLSQNYSSFALHQRIFKRSVIKGYFHNRNALQAGGADYSRAGSLEALLQSEDGRWRGFGGYGKAFTPGTSGSNYFYNIGGGFNSRNLSLYGNLAGVGNNYINDMGFIPAQFHYDAERDTTVRLGFHHWYTQATYTHYTENRPGIISHQWGLRNIVDATVNDLKLFANDVSLEYQLRLTNTSNLFFSYTHAHSNLLFPFTFTEREPLPTGHYFYDYGELRYLSDTRKLFSLESGLQYGSFYNGTRVQYSIGLKYRAQPWGNFAVNVVQNNLKFPIPYGDARLYLISPKMEINFSRQLFWTTFVQYNTQQDNFNINSRLQWRFKPMSDLFIVYSDNYEVDFWGPKSRALVVKINYWFNM